MYMRRPRWLSISLVVCGVGLPAAVDAQQLIASVKTGSITVTAGVARPIVTLVEGAPEVRAVFDDGAFEAEQCRPCVAGTVMGVGGRIIATGKGNQFYEVDFSLTGYTTGSAAQRVRGSRPHQSFHASGSPDRVTTPRSRCQ